MSEKELLKYIKKNKIDIKDVLSSLQKPDLKTEEELAEITKNEKAIADKKAAEAKAAKEKEAAETKKIDDPDIEEIEDQSLENSSKKILDKLDQMSKKIETLEKSVPRKTPSKPEHVDELPDGAVERISKNMFEVRI